MATRKDVVIIGIWGWNGDKHDGIANLCNKIVEAVQPLRVPANNIITTSWNPDHNSNPFHGPATNRHLRDIRARSNDPNYLAIIGHSFGGWAASKVSRKFTQEFGREPDFVALIDPVFGPPSHGRVNPYGQKMRSWYQRNGIFPVDTCTFLFSLCGGWENGLACGERLDSSAGVHQEEMNVDRDWEGNNRKVKCLFGKKDKRTCHMELDNHHFIWRQIVDHIVDDLQHPILAEIKGFGMDEGTKKTVHIIVTDAGSEAANIEVDGPSFISVEERPAGRFRLNVEPGFEDAGWYRVKVIATDAKGNSSETPFAVVVRDVNRAPTLVPFEPPHILGVDEGTKIVKEVRAFDEDNDELTFYISGPDFASIKSNNDGTAELTLAPTHEDAGQYPLKIGVLDAHGAGDEREVIVTVYNVNRPPILEPIKPQVVDEDSELSVAIRASDKDRQELDFSVRGPGFVSVENRAGNSADLVIKPTFEDAGQYFAFVTAADPEGGSDTKKVAITVNNVNRAPVLTPLGARTVGEGSRILQKIEAKDPDGQTVVLTAANLPRFARFTDNGDDTAGLLLKPGYKDAGLYELSITSTDPEGAVDMMGISIHVYNVLKLLHTQTDSHNFHQPEGVIELKIENLQPNLASQVQRLIDDKWVFVVNDNGDRAWYHETLRSNEEIRYGYGSNAHGGTYRWVIFDKAEGLEKGWAVSDPFEIPGPGKHITVRVALTND